MRCRKAQQRYQVPVPIPVSSLCCCFLLAIVYFYIFLRHWDSGDLYFTPTGLFQSGRLGCQTAAQNVKEVGFYCVNDSTADTCGKIRLGLLGAGSSHSSVTSLSQCVTGPSCPLLSPELSLSHIRLNIFITAEKDHKMIKTINVLVSIRPDPNNVCSAQWRMNTRFMC